MKKRILSLALALTMALGFSVTAFADEKTTTVTTTVPDPADAITYTYNIPATLTIEYGVAVTPYEVSITDVSPVDENGFVEIDGVLYVMKSTMSYTNLTSGENTLPVEISYDGSSPWNPSGTNDEEPVFKNGEVKYTFDYAVDWTNAKPGDYTGTITWKYSMGPR